MAPDQRGEVGDVVVLDIQRGEWPPACRWRSRDDGIEGEAQGAELLFLPLLKRASNLPAFTMVNTPAETMTQFRVVELGQNARRNAGSSM